MTKWLKLIGSAKQPLTEAPFHGVYSAEVIGFRKKNKPGIKAGDHLFLYAPGGSRRIFALAEAFRDPEPDPNYDPNEEGSCQWQVPIHYLINLPVADGILIDDIVSNQRDLTKSVQQASHIKLLPEESESAQRKLKTHDSTLPEEISQPSGLVEGAVRSIKVNAYERNPHARRQCIEAHGTNCCICGFNFGAVYGEVADGYIHVHHLRPLSQVNGEYVVDPVKDLRPVCPNCHAVLHLRGECRGIEDAKKMVEENRA